MDDHLATKGAGPVPQKIILYCDPGHDDAMAILLANASPAIELLAITTVAGNQTLPKTALDASRFLDLMVGAVASYGGDQ